MRIYFSNNYSMTLARQRCEAGTYPRQHLYGADALASVGHDVHFVDTKPGNLTTRLSAQLGWRAGDLNRLGHVLRRRSETAVDVAAEPYHAAALARLRRHRLHRHPLVAVFHGPLPRGSVSRALATGVDVAVCISALVRDQLVEEYGRDPERTPLLAWGPDLQFAGYVSTGSDFVVSAGKSGRDVETLADALEGLEVPARLYGLRPERASSVVSAVTTHRHEDLGGSGPPQFAFERVLPDLQAAAVVAIPLARTDRLLGLTEVADALALGKPIVMTRNPFLDVDIEAIGCGVWIERGDVAGWRRTLAALWAEPARRAAMGLAGRHYAEAHRNTETFGRGMVDAVQAAASLR